MTFPYMVKLDGIYFKAGEEIPSELIARDSFIPEEVKPEVAAEMVEEPKATKKPNTKKATK